MEIKETFKTTESETNGVWFEELGAKFKIASFNSPEYQKALRKGMIAQRRRLSRSALDPEMIREIEDKAIAEHILKDWKGITENGKEVPFSKEKALEYLTTMPKFNAMVRELSGSQAEFEDAEKKGAIENLKNG